MSRDKFNAASLMHDIACSFQAMEAAHVDKCKVIDARFRGKIPVTAGRYPLPSAIRLRVMEDASKGTVRMERVQRS